MTNNAVTPHAELWAHTTVTPAIDTHMARDEHATDAEHLIEAAGRNCYLSFHKPNAATQVNRDYLERTVFQQAHGSIAEHATATIYLTGVSRAFLTELTRHRHLSFSVLSQRFVDESQANVVLPPAVVDYLDTSGDSAHANELLVDALAVLDDTYEELATMLYDDFIHKGVDKRAARKKAREAARGILPNMTETRMVVTGNLRTWLEVLTRRMAPDADQEMREASLLIWNQLTTVSPVLFPHMEELLDD